MGGRGSGRKPYRHLTRVDDIPQRQPPLNGAVSDPEGVFGEFETLAAHALADNRLDAYRHVHEAAKVCHANGYDVRWHSLPYLVALSAALIDAKSARERNKLRAEVTSIYQDMKDWRNENA